MDVYSYLTMRRVVLASASPRRRDLLAAARIACRVAPADIPEVLGEGETAEQYVARLASEKAAAAPAEADELVLAADTTVVVDGQVLEKPRDAGDAARMLRLLSGGTHMVLTGICWRDGERARVAVERTLVRVARLSEEDIRTYVESGEPFGKAGAYGIQGMFSRWVDGVEGCYFNVVGLPVGRVWRELEMLAASLADARS